MNAMTPLSATPTCIGDIDDIGSPETRDLRPLALIILLSTALEAAAAFGLLHYFGVV